MKSLNKVYLAGSIALLALVLFNPACKKIQDWFTFSVSEETTITIPSSSPINLPFSVVSPDVTTNSSEQFKNNNTDVKYVKNIILENVQLTITDPAGQNFNFLKSIHVYISTNSTNEIQLAYLDQVPAGVNSITLIPTTAALDTYVKASSYSLRTEVVMNQILTQNVTVDAKTKFKVTANL